MAARSYSSTHACPQCNKQSGQRTQCDNCKTVGCNSAQCRHGGSGNSYCNFCGRYTKKGYM